MQLRNAFLILLLSCSFLACSTGPKTTQCISSPGESIFRCYDQIKQKNLVKKPAQVENYICLSPFDAEGYYTACTEKVKPPRVNFCIVGGPEENFLFHCDGNQIPFERTENFICMSPSDTGAVLNYCFSIRQGT